MLIFVILSLGALIGKFWHKSRVGGVFIRSIWHKCGVGGAFIK